VNAQYLPEWRGQQVSNLNWFANVRFGTPCFRNELARTDAKGKDLVGGD